MKETRKKLLEAIDDLDYLVGCGCIEGDEYDNTLQYIKNIIDEAVFDDDI